MYSKELDFVWKLFGAFAIFGVIAAIILFMVVPPVVFAWFYGLSGEPGDNGLYVLAVLLWLVFWTFVGMMLLVLEKKERSRWR